jgi:hypothetical protein
VLFRSTRIYASKGEYLFKAALEAIYPEESCPEPDPEADAVKFAFAALSDELRLKPGDMAVVSTVCTLKKSLRTIRKREVEDAARTATDIQLAKRKRMIILQERTRNRQISGTLVDRATPEDRENNKFDRTQMFDCIGAGMAVVMQGAGPASGPVLPLLLAIHEILDKNSKEGCLRGVAVHLPVRVCKDKTGHYVPVRVRKDKTGHYVSCIKGFMEDLELLHKCGAEVVITPDRKFNFDSRIDFVSETEYVTPDKPLDEGIVSHD